MGSPRTVAASAGLELPAENNQEVDGAANVDRHIAIDIDPPPISVVEIERAGRHAAAASDEQSSSSTGEGELPRRPLSVMSTMVTVAPNTA